jgi:hypothetical protein
MRLRHLLLPLGFCAAAACGWAQPAVRVAASRHVTIALVAPGGSTGLQREFTAKLAAALARSCPGLRIETLTARVAAARMTAGECDGVLITGPVRPAGLRRLEAPTIAAQYGAGYASTPVYFILSAGDSDLRDVLANGFTQALAPESARRDGMLAAQ